MAALPGMPRLRPGFRNANSTCYRVTAGDYTGRVGLGDIIEGYPSFSLRSKNAAGAVQHINVNVQDVQEINKAECADIPLGQILGGRHKRARSTRRHKRSTRRKATRSYATRRGRCGY
jgi:hypothetical protein